MATAKIIQNNTFQLTAGAAINGRDAIEIGPEGKAYPVVTTDYAAVSNCTYGTAQTSAATGRIVAQTLVTNQAANASDYGRMLNMLIGDDGSIFILGSLDSNTGVALFKYSAAGVLRGRVTVDATANHYDGIALVKLSNGNLALTWWYGNAYAVYTQGLAEVKAATTGITPAPHSSSQYAVTALTGGGWAMVWQSGADFSLVNFATWDNSGNAVVAPMTLHDFTTGGSENVGFSMEELSSGNLAIAISTYYTAPAGEVGLLHGVYTPAGVAVLSFTQIIGVRNNYRPYLSVVDGYYAIMRYDSTSVLAFAVFNNAGTQQGSTVTKGTSSPNNVTTFTNDGTSFYGIWNKSSDSTVKYISKITTAGVVTDTRIGTLIDIYAKPVDAFAENGLLVMMTQQSDYQVMYVIDLANMNLVNTAHTNVGTNTGGISINNTRLIPGGDYSFISFNVTTSVNTGLHFTVGKYANTSVVGVAAASAAQGDPVNIKQAAGTYICNTLKGTAAVAFDHTTGANISGNKGALLTNGVVLRGM